METKLAKLKTAYAAGDTAGTLRIAAKFGQLGPQREAITRAWQALQSPEFYRELGLDPATLVAVGMAAIRARYGLA